MGVGRPFFFADIEETVTEFGEVADPGRTVRLCQQPNVFLEACFDRGKRPSEITLPGTKLAGLAFVVAGGVLIRKRFAAIFASSSAIGIPVGSHRRVPVI
jgi:hypothetical protein